MPSSKQLYTRLMNVELEPVLSAIRRFRSSKKGKVEVGPHAVNVVSLRLRTFERDADGPELTRICCVTCKLQATHFGVESQTNNKSNDKPHLNLYGLKDGEEVLFTHDHTLARSLGGADNLSNTKTMCYPCNQEKSIGEREEHERRAQEAA